MVVVVLRGVLHRQKGRVLLWGQLTVPMVVVVLRGVLHRLRGTIVAAIVGRVVIVVIAALHAPRVVLCQELVHREVRGVLLAGVGNRVSVLVIVPIVVVVVHRLAERLLLQSNERWAIGPRVLDALSLHRQKGRVLLGGQLAVPVVVVVLRGVLHRLRGTIIAAVVGRVVIVVIATLHAPRIVL